VSKPLCTSTQGRWFQDDGWVLSALAFARSDNCNLRFSRCDLGLGHLNVHLGTPLHVQVLSLALTDLSHLIVNCQLFLSSLRDISHCHVLLLLGLLDLLPNYFHLSIRDLDKAAIRLAQFSGETCGIVIFGHLCACHNMSVKASLTGITGRISQLEFTPLNGSILLISPFLGSG